MLFRQKKLVLILGIFILLLCSATVLYLWPKGQGLFPSNSNEETGIKDNLKTIQISIGHDNLIAEVAETEAERQLGLGNRKQLAADAGMLFVFNHPERYGFWMKDTLIPLDMIWIDENKKIVDIKSDVLPSSYPKVFYPQSTALYVLETSAFFATKHELKIGDKLIF